MNVRATRRAMPIPMAMATPMLCVIGKLVREREPKAIMTVIPLVVMLSPAHVTEVFTLSSLSCPLRRSSRYLDMMNIA